MCRNGRYSEHGIKGLHGFARERYRAVPDALVRLPHSLADVGVLLEPTTIVAKISARSTIRKASPTRAWNLMCWSNAQVSPWS